MFPHDLREQSPRKLAAERDEIHRRWGEQHQRIIAEHQTLVGDLWKLFFLLLIYWDVGILMFETWNIGKSVRTCFFFRNIWDYFIIPTDELIFFQRELAVSTTNEEESQWDASAICCALAINAGWWFGCHFIYFPIWLGLLSSSQLTHIFQRGGPGPPTRTDSDVLGCLGCWSTGSPSIG